jgi:diadenosine tetraphosphate (Ap4A) HIT family hydrolase
MAAESTRDRDLFSGQHWSVELAERQTYLGRSKAVLRRKLENPLECSPEEHLELWREILPRFKAAADAAFHPTRINYGHIANADTQVHWHLVPRYENPPTREFAGVSFEDTNVGHNFAPAPPVPPEFTAETFQAIRAEILRHLDG